VLERAVCTYHDDEQDDWKVSQDRAGLVSAVSFFPLSPDRFLTSASLENAQYPDVTKVNPPTPPLTARISGVPSSSSSSSASGSSTRRRAQDARGRRRGKGVVGRVEGREELMRENRPGMKRVRRLRGQDGCCQVKSRRRELVELFSKSVRSPREGLIGRRHIS
jgi:hypothetical protein